MNFKTIDSKVSVAALSLLVAAMLAACGGGGSEATQPLATPSTPAAPAPDPTALQLQAPDLSGLSQGAAAALSYLNEARVRYGQGYLLPNAALQKAAQDHSKWIANAESIPEGAHYQVPGTPNFTGYSPADRVRNAGYAGASSEILSSITEEITFKSQQEADDAKQSGVTLMSPQALGRSFAKGQLNTVYHRYTALGPWREAGFGASYYYKAGVTSLGNYTVASTVGLSMGCQAQCQYPNNTSLLVYPAPESVADGLGFGNEVPNPAPDLAPGAILGFPVTIETTSEIVKVEIFDMTDSNGNLVPSRVHTAATDPARWISAKQAFLLPLSALKPNTKYTVVLKLETKTGQLEKTWSFVTPNGN